MENKKIALCCMVDSGYKIPFETMVTSLIENNPWFDLPIIIIDTGLDAYDKKDILKVYNNIIIKPINNMKYKKVKMDGVKKEIFNTIYTLDAFSYTEYDKIIFLDSDMLILDNIQELFYGFNEKGFYGAKCFNIPKDGLLDDINAGCFVINFDKLPKDIYDRLIKVGESKPHRLPEQMILNEYFEKDKGYLPKVFNCEKRVKESKGKEIKYEYKGYGDDIFINNEKVKILHYVSFKPWFLKFPDKFNENYEDLERIWFKYYGAMLRRKLND